MEGKTKTTMPQVEMVKDLILRSKLQSGTIVSFLGVLFTVYALPWFKAKFLGVSSSFTLGDGEMDTSKDFFIMVLSLIGIAAAGFVIFTVYRKMTKLKITLMSSMVALGVTVLNILLGTWAVLDINEKGLSVGMGYYLFMLLNLVIAGFNGLELYKNQKLTMQILQSAKKNTIDMADDFNINDSAEKKTK